MKTMPRVWTTRPRKSHSFYSPRTAIATTLAAFSSPSSNASRSEIAFVGGSTPSSSTTLSVSTCSANAVSARSAVCRRRAPSNGNGHATTAVDFAALSLGEARHDRTGSAARSPAEGQSEHHRLDTLQYPQIVYTDLNGLFCKISGPRL